MVLHLPLFCVCYDYNFRKGKANRFVFVDGYMKTELGSLTSIKTGKLDANASSENGIYPFFTCAVEPLKIDSYSYDCECVLVAGNGDLNVKYYNGKFDAYQRTYIIESKDKSKLTVPYLYYFLESYIETLRSQSIGGIIKYIKIGNLTNASIPILSIEKQNKIVKTLDKAKSIITHLRTQLEKLDLLVKARFVEMFGDVINNTKRWKIYLFSEITISRLGKMLDKKSQTGKSKLPYLANFNVQWFQFKLDNLNMMDFNEKEQIEFSLEDDDLLVCEGGEIGRCAIWHNEITPCYFQKALHRVRCNKSIIIPIYLAWWFKFNCDNNGFSEIEGAKATIAHLPGAKLKKLPISVPPLTLQNQFADFVKQIDKSKSILQQELDKAQMLFDSLMQEYFG